MSDDERAPHELWHSEPRPPRPGTEPVTARSDLPLRLLLSAVFVPLFALITVAFAIWWASTGAGETPSRDQLRVLALGCGALTVLAAIDLAVVRRRISRHDKG
jgi:hypothetical protein